MKPTNAGYFQAANDIVLDSLGNSYTVGYFQGNTDFDPGPGTFNLHGGPGGTDIYILKLSPAGDFIWAKHLNGNVTQEWGYSIAIDDSSNLYVVGDFVYTVDFDPGPALYNLTATSGSREAFVLKLKSNGDFVWVKKFEGSNFITATSIEYNNSNVYIAGHFRDTADFDPGVLNHQEVGLNGRDGYLCKLDANGNFQWVRTYGGPEWFDEISDVSIDSNGDLYIVGYFSDTVDLDPGPDTLTYISSSSWQDMFIQKLDENGIEIWTSVIQGPGSENGNSIHADKFGNVYCTGRITDTVDFDPGPGTFNVSSSSIGLQDCFLLKLSASMGDFIWVKMIAGPEGESGGDVVVDSVGNVYLAGGYDNLTDFDPGPGTYNLVSNGTGIYPYLWDDAFLVKLTPAGDLIWAFGYGGIDQDQVFSIAYSDAGYIYACGLFSNTVDFNPGAGVDNVVSNNMSGYVYKISECFPGTSVDSHIECTSFTWIDGLTYTNSNNTSTFTIPNASANGCDSIVQLDLTILLTSSSTDHITACDSTTWIDGITYTSDNFSATHVLTNTVGCDSTITLNLNIDYTVTTVENVTECDSFYWAADGNTISSTGTYSNLLSTLNGCDSTVILNLTILQSDSTVETITACASYFWTADGNAYFSTGVYEASLLNQNGCDSVITLDLTILPEATGTDVQTSCDSLVWIDGNTYFSSNSSATYSISGGSSNGCDSIVNLDLTIHPSATRTDVQTSCDSLVWIDGNTYFSSNNTAAFSIPSGGSNGCDSIVNLDLTILPVATGTDVLTSCDTLVWIDGNTYYANNNTATFNIIGGASNGCDSIVTLNLSINTISDITTTVNGNTISSNNANATYQWLDCDSNYDVIIGETGQNFTAMENGNYAIELTENGCVDTTACESVVSVRIIENSFESDIKLYPNPTKGNFTIDLGVSYNSTEISIFDIYGKLVRTNSFAGSQFLHLAIDESPGIYFVVVEAADYRTILKIQKE